MELSSFTASVTLRKSVFLLGRFGKCTYINEFGFFFFLRMAVAVSSFCGGSVRATSARRLVIATSLCSAPDGSLPFVSSYISLSRWWQAHTLKDPPWACDLAQPTFWWPVCVVQRAGFLGVESERGSRKGGEMSAGEWGARWREMVTSIRGVVV